MGRLTVSTPLRKGLVPSRIVDIPALAPRYGFAVDYDGHAYSMS